MLNTKNVDRFNTILENDSLILDELTYLLLNNLCTVKETISSAKKHGCLYKLLSNKKLFQELIKNNTMTKEDLKHLLNEIDNYRELHELFNINEALSKKVLQEFVLESDTVSKFNELTKDSRWCEYYDIHTIFEMIEFRTSEFSKKFGEQEVDEEVLNLNALNKYVYSLNLNEDQKLKVVEVLKNNEVAQNRLKSIVENNLGPNYDFDSLMNCLKKKEKKSILNV